MPRRKGTPSGKPLREKVLLLQEVHHRVKNNPQIINGPLNMQFAAVADARLASAFEECQRCIRSMSRIHERLYDSSSLTHMDFAEYVYKLADKGSKGWPMFAYAYMGHP